MKYLIILIFFFGCYGYEMSPCEKTVNKILQNGSAELSKKYHIHPIATGASMPEGDLKYLELGFQVEGPLSKEKIRELLVLLAEDFLTEINTRSDLSKHLDEKKLTIDNVSIVLFLVDSSSREIRLPNIGIADILERNLTYWILNETNGLPVLDTIYKETYEEAKQLLAQEH